jgi:chromosome transmission fidelity protein 4
LLSDLVIKVVHTQDMEKVLYLRDQSRPVKHVTFDRSGTVLAASCSNGVVYFYSLSSEQPQLLKKLDGLVQALETDVEITSRIVWHPDGRAFGGATNTRDFQVVSRSDWENQKAFKDGHNSDITAAAWSPNGALLVTTSVDRKLVLWDSKTLKIFKTYDDIRATILTLQWHPTENILSYTNNDGELFIHTDFVPEEHLSLLSKSVQPAPFIHDPLDGTSGALTTNGHANGNSVLGGQRDRPGTPDTFDGMSLGFNDMDGFVDDDDGAGYAEMLLNQNGKRTNGHLSVNSSPYKRPMHSGTSRSRVQAHESFQPGSTPWRGNRRYLCLNLIGVVWTVDQETHHTVTVEFYDREFSRDFHFTDPWMYDKACLNENGTLFSCQPKDSEPAQIYYRPHETWTARTEWKTKLPPGEEVTAIALSNSYIVVSTSANYIRIYTLFGTPFRIYRQKASPAVTCAAWRDYVLTIGNGPVGSDNNTQLVYTIENVKRDEVYQSEDIVALSPGSTLDSVFFSDSGDPFIYDSTGTLLVLEHWRRPGQARWVPLLDTRLLDRLSAGRKEERYWPVAVANERFHCIILKGGDTHPYFPRPLLSDFEFKLPLSHVQKPEGEDDAMQTDTLPPSQLEHAFVLNSVLGNLLSDLLETTRATHSQRVELARRDLEGDKALLQLLANECRDGEDRGMKALEIVGLMKDGNGKMIDAAKKVATRYGRDLLAEKIADLAERRLMGEDGNDDTG